MYVPLLEEARGRPTGTTIKHHTSRPQTATHSRSRILSRERNSYVVDPQRNLTRLVHRGTGGGDSD